MTVTGVACGDCGRRIAEPPGLPIEERSPCPSCGSTRRRVGVGLAATVRSTGSLSWVHRHEFWERNRLLLVLVVVITLGSPLLGLIVGGLVGVIVGLALGIVGAVIGAKAVVRVRELRHGSA